MSLQVNLPPINCYEIVGQNLEHLNTLVPVKQEGAFLKMTKPLAIYDVRVSDELKNGIIDPKLTGWRCFVVHNDEAISMADIAVNKKGENPKFLYFTKGDIVNKILSKISELESLDAVKGKHYEVRLLRISAVNLMAVWLHGEGEELIYPLGKPLSENSPYTFSQIFAKISDLLKSLDATGSLTPSP
jgi:hypothetical protein